jgi:polysaccharide biosynthesis protein VpsM
VALVADSLGTKFFPLMVLGACSFVPDVHAQEPESVEHSTLEPSIFAELRYDDNIFLSAADELSSLVTIVSPGLLASVKPGRHRFQLGYRGEFGSYANSSPDNYDDHKFQAAAFLEVGRRGLLDLSTSYEDGHEQRGTGLSEGLEPGSGAFLSEPDEFNETQLGGRYTFGATGTKGRLVFDAGRRELEYSNNRDRTRFFDYNQVYGGATFYFRVLPSTSLLLGVRADDFDYQLDRSLQPSLDSREHRVLFGATWDITGKSTGTVRSGYVEKRYDDGARPTFSGTNWSVDVRWSLRSYSHLDIATSRYPSEITSLTGDFIENTNYSVAWTHHWTARTNTRLSILQSRQDFRRSIEARAETFDQYGLALVYDMRRWLTWEFGVSVSSRDSNIDRFKFDANVVSLRANLAF